MDFPYYRVHIRHVIIFVVFVVLFGLFVCMLLLCCFGVSSSSNQHPSPLSVSALSSLADISMRTLIYIYIERERCMCTYIYIYMYTHIITILLSIIIIIIIIVIVSLISIISMLPGRAKVCAEISRSASSVWSASLGRKYNILQCYHYINVYHILL